MNVSVMPEILISTEDIQHLFEMAGRVTDSWDVAEHLFGELERATIVKPWAVPENVATMHSLVYYQNEETGRTRMAKLVYPHEVDGSPGQLSIMTPAGAALLGLSAGDRIRWPIQGGCVLHYHLLQVIYQPSALS